MRFNYHIRPYQARVTLPPVLFQLLHYETVSYMVRNSFSPPSLTTSASRLVAQVGSNPHFSFLRRRRPLIRRLRHVLCKSYKTEVLTSNAQSFFRLQFLSFLTLHIYYIIFFLKNQVRSFYWTLSNIKNIEHMGPPSRILPRYIRYKRLSLNLK